LTGYIVKGPYLPSKLKQTLSNGHQTNDGQYIDAKCIVLSFKLPLYYEIDQ